MKVFTYAGNEPTVHLAEERKLALTVMLQQLDVLKVMMQTVVMIPEGTRISPVSTAPKVPTDVRCEECRAPMIDGQPWMRSAYGYAHPQCVPPKATP